MTNDLLTIRDVEYNDKYEGFSINKHTAGVKDTGENNDVRIAVGEIYPFQVSIALGFCV